VPITVTAPRGQLTESGEREVLPALTDALLEATDSTGNDFLRSIVGGTVHVLEQRAIYAGGINRPIVMVEVKLPAVALATPERLAAFIAAATDAVDAATVADHRRDDTWVNVIHACDGAWGIGGRAYRNADMSGPGEPVGTAE
jgi:phenylpyruvate tautomerase PptA (4-oxalocrotonate tautomerase family)